MIEISAVLCTYNREKYLPKALESLANQTFSTEKFEIVLINNNSTDSTDKICEEFCLAHPEIHFKYFVEKQQGLSFARNRGIEESEAKLITYIDDDAWLDELFLENVVNFMNENSEVASVGGKILLDYEAEEPKWMNKYIASLLGYFVYSEKTEAFSKSNFPRGSNMTFKKDVFDVVGGFNTELGRIGRSMGGGEEKDIYQRIYSSNFIVYNLPSAIVHHAVPLFRTERDFIRKQAIGVGSSERIRVKGDFSASLVRFWQEFYKWLASIVLFFLYNLELKPAKAKMIVRIRWWISTGLFFYKRSDY